MSVKVAVIVALALLSTLGGLTAYHFTHRGANKNVVVDNSTTTEDSKALFEAYKINNGLKFGAAENSKRLEVFTNNLEIIAAHNAKQSSYKLGVTSLTHLTREEFAALKLGFSGVKSTENVPASEPVAAVSADGEVDWTTKGAVTPVKNQGSCGSCWAFSSTGALEGLHQLNNGELVSLSEQELVDCSGSYGNYGCSGGLMDNAFQYVAEHGLSSEADYGYTATDGDCQSDKTKVVKNTGHTDVPANDNDALVAAISGRPVSVAIEADTSAFQLYKSGVLTGDACGTQLDHGVLAVGYGTDNGVAYIKVKNSWGGDWGKDGFILIGQASGAGTCGINQAASYPTL